MKSYQVKSIDDNTLTITGKGNDRAWEHAEVLSDFVSPWDKTDIDKIEFRALYNTEYLFFCFKVFDADIYVDSTDETHHSINNSDRVELFFRADKNLNPYYCLEIDPTPRIMDFMAKPNKDFNFYWNWPTQDICVKSDIGDNFFTVEGAISLASLKRFKLLKDGKIETGIYRAKYKKQPDESYQPTWITWVDPKTTEPNFHTASSFGVLKLM
ncbi:sugar-binding protein [Hwangdonia lutea]|uniref:Carbohydrate-binding family 9-like protein n=1 Tax=Hwangdonia lutea TaxID=3075823 RepID=A0AA97HPJ0_9FLAO|nr:sugar-binding protein [Hwangdonia sp. SCSIO 19198]WOD42692.1 carbohydrate-binding family 9-like protein [Hwangdonia sp. SCSIO 19198]